MSAPSSRVVRLHALLLGALSSAALADPGGIPAEVQALRGRVDAIQAQQASAQAQLGGLLSAVTNLTAASNSLRTAITALTGTDAAMQAKIAGLQSSVSVLQSTSTALSGQLAALQTANYTTPRFTATPSCVVSAQQGQQPAEGANYYCKLDGADAAGLTVQCYAPPSLAFAGNFASFVRNAASVGNFQFICAQ